MVLNILSRLISNGLLLGSCLILLWGCAPETSVPASQPVEIIPTDIMTSTATAQSTPTEVIASQTPASETAEPTVTIVPTAEATPTPIPMSPTITMEANVSDPITNENSMAPIIVVLGNLETASIPINTRLWYKRHAAPVGRSGLIPIY